MSELVGTGNGGRRRFRPLALVAVAAVLAAGPVGTASAQLRPFGDVRRLAPGPTPPGFPEGIAVWGQRVYVVGPATFGTAGGPPSAVLILGPGGQERARLGNPRPGSGFPTTSPPT